MDVNGLPLWNFDSAASFGLGAGASSGLKWDADDAQLTLASEQFAPQLAEDEDFARRMLSLPSPICDAAGCYAYWDHGRQLVAASGFAEGVVEIDLGVEEGDAIVRPDDLALGTDQIVYAARNGEIVMHDLRGRYPLVAISHPDFSPALLAPAKGGGAYCFDIGRNRLGKLAGYPLRPQGLTDPKPEQFKPVDPNPDPPTIRVLSRTRLAARFKAVALASSPEGQLALLAWQNSGDVALFILRDRKWVQTGELTGIRFAWSIAWHGEEIIAVMASDGAKAAQQAYLYDVASTKAFTGERAPMGHIYLLRDAWPGGFCNGANTNAQFLTTDPDNPTVPIPVPTGVRRIIAVSGNQYARNGHVLIGPIDSNATGTVWHRLYAEAKVAEGSGFVARVYASDNPEAPRLPDADGAFIWGPDWAVHLFGRAGAPSGANTERLPRAAWCNSESELPGEPSRLCCDLEIDKAGLFTVLLQHSDRRVRRISGRYGWIALELNGNSHGTPQIAALRLYAKRFSYRDAYLPDFFGETLAGPDAAEAGSATPADFLDRMLGLYEGPLTEIEGRVAGAWRMTDPNVAPDAALPWIASWIGIRPDPSENPAQLRQRLVAAPFTAGLNGTLGGLLAALEMATGGQCVIGGRMDLDAGAAKPGELAIARLDDRAVRALYLGQDNGGRHAMLVGGGVSRGDIVVVEGFRLRRTFATILGADLADEDDPLTLGLATSGNSFVGDTLILGETASADLAALFRADMDFARNDQAAVQAFFAHLAFRALILLRGYDDPIERLRLSEIVAEAIPAHIQPDVQSATDPLIVGASALVGIQTYLTTGPSPQRFRLDGSLVGRGDQIQGLGWLDGRADGPRALAPTARASGPESVWTGSPFVLSALGSRAAPGGAINRYIWTWEGQR